MKMGNNVIDALVGGFRALRRNPRLATIMVATLALGLGANTTIFSLVQSVLFLDADFGRSTGREVGGAERPARLRPGGSGEW